MADSRPAAYLLDLDGTLIDSEPFHKKAEVLAFRQMGLTIEPSDLFPCTGMTLPAMLDSIAERFRFHTTVDEFLAIQQPFFRQIIVDEVELFPDGLAFLQRTGSIPKAIVTSSMPWYLEVVTQKHPILVEATEFVVCAADVDRGKPDPEPFALAVARMGLPAASCWAVEDSLNGVRSARSAGCRVFGMDRDRHGHLQEADHVLVSFDDLS